MLNDPPAWVRAIVNEANTIPLTELRDRIKLEAAALPAVLHDRSNGDVQPKREALLSIKMTAGWLLEAMGTHDKQMPVPPVADEDLPSRLAAAATQLPKDLDNGSLRRRSRKLYQVEVLAHRLLANLLGLLLFAGCPLCQLPL